MAEKIATGYVEIKTEVDKLRRELAQARQTIDGNAKKMEDRMTTTTKSIGKGWISVGKAVAGAFAVIQSARGVVNIAQQFVAAASAAEQFQVRLKVLLGSQAEGNRMFKEMASYASRVPFEYQHIMESATALSGVMKGGVDEVKEWMPLVGDLAAATGMTVTDVTGQVIRMYSAGAASADMFRERGVLAMLGFQAGVKYSAEETREMLMKAWQDPASKFKDATGEMEVTWKGTTSMLSDAWFDFSKTMGESIIGELLPAVRLLTKELKGWSAFMKERSAFEMYDELAEKQKQLARQQAFLARAEQRGLWESWNQYDQNVDKLKEEIYQLKEKLGIVVAISEVPPPVFAGGAPEEGEEEVHMRPWGDLAAIDDSIAEGLAALEDAYAQEMEIREGHKVGLEDFFSLSEEDEVGYWARVSDYQAGELKKRELQELKSQKKQQQNELKFKKSMIALDVQTATAKKTIAYQAGSALLQMAGASSREIFFVMKAMDIALAIAGTHAGAAMALASLPFPANLAAAAKVTAVGYWNVAAIAATAIGQAAVSSGGGGGSVGGGSYISPVVTTPATESPTLEPVPVADEEEAKGRYTIVVEGDVLADEYFIELLAEKISEAVEDKEVRLISTEAQRISP